MSNRKPLLKPLYRSTLSVACLCAALAVPNRATATSTCPSAPTNWAAADCTINGNVVCDVSGTLVFCDVSWSTDDAQVVMVTDFDPSTHAVVAWGTASYNVGMPPTTTQETFCCPLDPLPLSITDAEITGSNHADDLRFTWTYGGNTYSQHEAINDFAYGGGGSDTITGSLDTQVLDNLYGEGHHDTINALDGTDYLEGGDGPDVMAGGPGIDEMHGGEDSDTMTGGDGTDSMYGDGDRDYMNGGPNDDYVDGGLGPDVLCGGGEDLTDPDDIVTDGDSNAEPNVGDVIWSSQVGDAAQCNASNTQWDWVANDPLTTCVRTGGSPHPQYTPPAGATMPPGCP